MAAPDKLSPATASRSVFQLGLAIAIGTVIIDQLHKWWMISIVGIQFHERMTITPFMDFVFVINKGISYGLFSQGSQTGQYMLAAFAMVVAAALLIWLARAWHSRLSAVGIGLVVGGAVGNGIDRMHLGGVADFIQLHAFGFYWYVFNIADVAIVVGVAALLYDSWITSRGGAAKGS